MTAVRDLLFELGTEELPPRTLTSLSLALQEGMIKGIDSAGIPHGGSRRFATPRRLAVRIEACGEAAPDRVVERRGPPVSSAFDAAGAATQAATAFAKSCGVDVAELERLTTDKGTWLAYRGVERGASLASLLSGIINLAVASLPIAKRMRWGAHSVEFVRPVHSLVVLHGEEIIPIDVLGLKADRLTRGHRFHAPRPISITSASSYDKQMRRGRVIVDFAARRALIRAGVDAAARTLGGVALIEDALLDEVTALVEWPVPIAGHFEGRFLALPREVIIATVQDHQRYFAVEDAGGALTGGFVTVSNIQSRDPAKVREGNERVVRPRLSDAAFFWEQDRSTTLDAHAARLGGVIFQTKLGTYAEKTTRIKALALAIGRHLAVGGDLSRAAELAKADLMTAMVGEFPELQGTMGRYYAEAQGESSDVAVALEEHYKPRFAADSLPVTDTGRILALADRLDTMAGIFAIELRPSGTKDPFGLRRAALGVLRIILEGRLPLDLNELLQIAASLQPVQRNGVAGEVYDFIAERLRGLLLERADGTSADMIDAVLAAKPGSPLDIEARLLALKMFLLLPDAAGLTALNKRIGNILRKAPAGGGGVVRSSVLSEPAEIALHAAVQGLEGVVNEHLSRQRYREALQLVGDLRVPVGDFFDSVMVMDGDADRRSNRLALLRDVQTLLGGVADLSRLPG